MLVSSNNRYDNLGRLKIIAAFGIVAMHMSLYVGDWCWMNIRCTFCFLFYVPF